MQAPLNRFQRHAINVIYSNLKSISDDLSKATGEDNGGTIENLLWGLLSAVDKVRQESISLEQRNSLHLVSENGTKTDTSEKHVGKVLDFDRRSVVPKRP